MAHVKKKYVRICPNPADNIFGLIKPVVSNEKNIKSWTTSGRPFLVGFSLVKNDVINLRCRNIRIRRKFQPNSDKISAPQNGDVILVGTHGAIKKNFLFNFFN